MPETGQETTVVITFGESSVTPSPDTVPAIPGNSVRFQAAGGAIAICMPDDIGDLFNPPPDDTRVELARGSSIAYQVKDAGGRNFAVMAVEADEEGPRVIDPPTGAGPILFVRGSKWRSGPDGVIQD